MLLVMHRVRRHYDRVAAETASQEPANFRQLPVPLVITPVASWSKISEKALRFAYNISHEIRAVHISAADETSDGFCQHWMKLAQAPAIAAGLPPPELVVLDSPYRWVLRPILEYVLEVEKQNPDREIVVVLPEMVERHWYHYFMHNNAPRFTRPGCFARQPADHCGECAVAPEGLIYREA